MNTVSPARAAQLPPVAIAAFVGKALLQLLPIFLSPTLIPPRVKIRNRAVLHTRDSDSESSHGTETDLKGSVCRVRS